MLGLIPALFPVLLIAALVVGVIGIAALVLAPRLRVDRVVFDASPDLPASFGYSMSWLAIKTTDTQRLVQTLGLIDPIACNWSTGIGAVYDDELGPNRVFVSPPVQGWTFVVGLALPHPASARFVDKATPQLLSLSEKFHDVQYFMSYPLIDLFAWSRATDGKLARSFAIAEHGIIANSGRTTKEERAIGLKLFELRGLKARNGDLGSQMLLYPTEQHVMRVAKQWSLDPSDFTKLSDLSKGTGLIAFAPQHWRSELHRKAAA